MAKMRGACAGKTSWASSRSCLYRIKIPAEIRSGLYSMIKGFVLRRESLLKRIAAQCPLPSKASRGRTYLETLLNLDLPDDLRKELVSLIRTRDIIVYFIVALPWVQRFVRSYIKNRLGEYFDPQGTIENTVILSIAQGLDRMAPDKIGLRVDFLVANLQRAIPGLARIKQGVPLVPRNRRTDDPYAEYQTCSEEVVSTVSEEDVYEMFC